MESIPLINFELSFSKFCFRLPPQLPSLPPSHLHTFSLLGYSFPYPVSFLLPFSFVLLSYTEPCITPFSAVPSSSSLSYSLLPSQLHTPLFLLNLKGQCHEKSFQTATVEWKTKYQGCFVYLKMAPIEVKQNSCWAPVRMLN